MVQRDAYKNSEELTTVESLSLLEQLADLGCKYVVLSGGEPFVRSDWAVLSRKIKDLGMYLSIISNAYAINDDVIDILYYLSPDSLAFSLDGSNPATHDYIRGREGTFEHLLGVMKKMKARSIPYSAASTINKKNLPELQGMLDILLEHGAFAWQIQIAKPRGKMPKDLILNEREYYTLAETIVEFRKKYNDTIRIVEADCIGYYSKLTPSLEITDWNGCQCGIQAVAIECDGGVKGCIAMVGTEGNIRETSLKDIWNDYNKFAYNRRFTPSMLKGYCKKCKFGHICRGGCSENTTSSAGTEDETPYCLYKIESAGYSD